MRLISGLIIMNTGPDLQSVEFFKVFVRIIDLHNKKSSVGRGETVWPNQNEYVHHSHCSTLTFYAPAYNKHSFKQWLDFKLLTKT